jgi:hypothetical protein
MLIIQYVVQQRRSSWDATVEWWASIEAARHCAGFVGHMASAATRAIYNALCMENSEDFSLVQYYSPSNNTIVEQGTTMVAGGVLVQL